MGKLDSCFKVTFLYKSVVDPVKHQSLKFPQEPGLTDFQQRNLKLMSFFRRHELALAPHENAKSFSLTFFTLVLNMFLILSQLPSFNNFPCGSPKAFPKMCLSVKKFLFVDVMIVMQTTKLILQTSKEISSPIVHKFIQLQRKGKQLTQNLRKYERMLLGLT